MGTVFSKCMSKNLGELILKTTPSNSEYKTLQIEDKIYILFENKQPGDCFEILTIQNPQNL